MAQQSLRSILPKRAASLDQRGVHSLLTAAQADPALAAVAANRLERFPKATLKRLFRLSAAQRQAIERAPPAELKTRLLPVVDRLRSGAIQPDQVRYSPGKRTPIAAGKTPGEGEITCTCTIEF